jgi:hypothetical protein
LPNLTSRFALVLVLLLPVGAQALALDHVEVGSANLLDTVPGVGEELSDESGLSTSDVLSGDLVRFGPSVPSGAVFRVFVVDHLGTSSSLFGPDRLFAANEDELFGRVERSLFPVSVI